jgi:hypothetical protein
LGFLDDDSFLVGNDARGRTVSFGPAKRLLGCHVPHLRVVVAPGCVYVMILLIPILPLANLTGAHGQLFRVVLAKKPLRTGTTLRPLHSGQAGFAFSRCATVIVFSNCALHFTHRKT